MNDAEYEEAYQAILDVVLEYGGKLRMGSCVDEGIAAKLLGYASADTLRKRVSQGTNNLPYKIIGNRRFYDLKGIAKVWAKTY